MKNWEARAIINANIAERWPGIGTLPVRYSYMRCANAIRGLYDPDRKTLRFMATPVACAYLRLVANRILAWEKKTP